MIPYTTCTRCGSLNIDPLTKRCENCGYKLIAKKDLENKIADLEGKLSQLSGQISKPKVDRRIVKGSLPKGWDNDPYPPPPPPPSGTLPRGFGKRSGTLPKGFGNSPFTTICLMKKKRAKQLYKEEKCLGCGQSIKFDKEKHYILCKNCTSRLDAYEHTKIRRILKKWRIKERKKHAPLLKALMVKLKLAEIKK